MAECWAQDPAARPSFPEVAARLSALMHWQSSLARITARMRARSAAHAGTTRGDPRAARVQRPGSAGGALMGGGGSGPVGSGAGMQGVRGAGHARSASAGGLGLVSGSAGLDLDDEEEEEGGRSAQGGSEGGGAGSMGLPSIREVQQTEAQKSGAGLTGVRSSGGGFVAGSVPPDSPRTALARDAAAALMGVASADSHASGSHADSAGGGVSSTGGDDSGGSSGRGPGSGSKRRADGSSGGGSRPVLKTATRPRLRDLLLGARGRTAHTANGEGAEVTDAASGSAGTGSVATPAGDSAGWRDRTASAAALRYSAGSTVPGTGTDGSSIASSVAAAAASSLHARAQMIHDAAAAAVAAVDAERTGGDGISGGSPDGPSAQGGLRGVGGAGGLGPSPLGLGAEGSPLSRDGGGNGARGRGAGRERSEEGEGSGGGGPPHHRALFAAMGSNDDHRSSSMRDHEAAFVAPAMPTPELTTSITPAATAWLNATIAALGATPSAVKRRSANGAGTAGAGGIGTGAAGVRPLVGADSVPVTPMSALAVATQAAAAWVMSGPTHGVAGNPCALATAQDGVSNVTSPSPLGVRPAAAPATQRMEQGGQRQMHENTGASNIGGRGSAPAASIPSLPPSQSPGIQAGSQPLVHPLPGRQSTSSLPNPSPYLPPAEAPQPRSTWPAQPPAGSQPNVGQAPQLLQQGCYTGMPSATGHWQQYPHPATSPLAAAPSAHLPQQQHNQHMGYEGQGPVPFFGPYAVGPGPWGMGPLQHPFHPLPPVANAPAYVSPNLGMGMSGAWASGPQPYAAGAGAVQWPLYSAMPPHAPNARSAAVNAWVHHDAAAAQQYAMVYRVPPAAPDVPHVLPTPGAVLPGSHGAALQGVGSVGQNPGSLGSAGSQGVATLRGSSAGGDEGYGAGAEQFVVGAGPATLGSGSAGGSLEAELLPPLVAQATYAVARSGSGRQAAAGGTGARPHSTVIEAAQSAARGAAPALISIGGVGGGGGHGPSPRLAQPLLPPPLTHAHFPRPMVGSGAPGQLLAGPAWYPPGVQLPPGYGVVWGPDGCGTALGAALRPGPLAPHVLAAAVRAGDAGELSSAATSGSLSPHISPKV